MCATLHLCSHTHRLPGTIKIEENAVTSPSSRPLEVTFESTTATQEPSTATTPVTTSSSTLARTSGTASTNVQGTTSSEGMQ